MTDPTDTITIENVVASGDTGREFDLQTLAEDLDNAQYDPKTFPGIVYRIDEPKSAGLIFHTGKVVCTGSKSVEDINKSVESIFNAFERLGISIEENPFTVQNIVSSADLGYSLNLNAVAVGLGLGQIEYEPEQFPGLVYRLDEPDVVALLFGSGKTVITGGTEVQDATNAVNVIASKLEDLGLNS
ncbi:TATA-box-binding protein [Natronococcus occultus]|uniref:TATA-box-binding protein n=1 Tax=Natronococcus occultus SP4 TaxID=694430 RepID=L0JW95_9EURY|nr:TATA-box-binding protein [Natronococcus occultus]AGB37046.1 TATA-box binding protein (TBP), component of TFIID and TFIIIB [Natronococcus occultus SP4]